ncbi:MAG: hypothetical protein Ct9H300mP12_04850 [Acidimicrobiales bacterium]|nr:MAG: hypothetical protein Ct9H300mP12_04850 [Acidimicrobiales bacterium]
MTESLAVPEVDVDDLQKMLAEGARVLDVREPDEVDEVRVARVDSGYPSSRYPNDWPRSHCRALSM